MTFPVLVGASINRLFSTKRTPRIKVIVKGPPFQFLLFKRNIQNQTRLKAPFNFFQRCGTFFEFFSVFKVSPSILVKSPLVISLGVKRYIRTILRFCKEEAEVRKQEFFMKTSYVYVKNCAL